MIKTQRHAGNLPTTQTCEIVTGFVHSREERSFCRRLNYEVIKVQEIDHRNSPTDTFHELAVPIDSLDDRLIMQAAQLTNLRCMTFNNPTSLDVFMAKNRCVIKTAINILIRVRSLVKISLCVDMLNDDIFHALSSHSCLREVRLLQPTPSFPNQNAVAQIEDILHRGIPRLPQVECFRIPADLATDTVLSTLGQLPSLHYMEITGSTNVPYLGHFFIECLGSLHPSRHTPGFFTSLKLLKIEEKVLGETLLSNQIVRKTFPNMRFIKIY